MKQSAKLSGKANLTNPSAKAVKRKRKHSNTSEVENKDENTPAVADKDENATAVADKDGNTEPKQSSASTSTTEPTTTPSTSTETPTALGVDASTSTPIAATPATAPTESDHNLAYILGGVLLLGEIGAIASRGGSGGSTTPIEQATGYLIDSPVAGVDYYLNGSSTPAGKTGSDGSFKHKAGDKVTFKIGNITLAEMVNVPSDKIVYLQDLAGVSRDNPTDGKVVKLAQLIQSLDSDNNPSNGITIDESKLKDGLGATPITAKTDIATLLDAGVTVVTPQDALDHVNNNDPSLVKTDNTAPTVLSIEMDTALKAGETTTVLITFSEEIVAFDGIVTAENGTLTPVSASLPKNQLQYTFTPYADITDTTNVIKVTDAYTDLLGNKGKLGQTNYTIDTKIPTATIKITDSNGDNVLTLGETATVTVQFSEVVDWGLLPLDSIMSAQNGTLGGFVKSNGGLTYTGSFTPNAGVFANESGANVITLDLSKVTDSAGNHGTLLTSDTYTVNKPRVTTNDLFNNIAQAQKGYDLDTTAGMYRTMFEFASASYWHKTGLNDVPTMQVKEDVLAKDSYELLKRDGVDFSISAQELSLPLVMITPVLGVPVENNIVYQDGYYVCYQADSLDKSSVALVGRTENTLFITFRGSDVPADWLDDFGAPGTAYNMTVHYQRFAPLFDGINNYLTNHPEITDVYVGGHSLGGEMAAMFMQENVGKTNYHAVTYEAANKQLGDNIGDSRFVNFEMRGDAEKWSRSFEQKSPIDK